LKKKFRSFEESHAFVRVLGLKNRKEWREYCKSGKKPGDIPQQPDKIYKNKGWISMGDWLGTGNIASRDRKFKSFVDARNYVRTLGLKNRDEWVKFSKTNKKPDDIPRAPSLTYKNKGWKGWGDWTGSGTVQTQQRHYLSFEEARKFVYELGLKSANEWREYYSSDKKPSNIPAAPNITYKDKGWKGWGDWLGTGTLSPTEKKKLYLPFNEARKFVHSLELKNQNDWIEYCKSNDKPKYIPSTPETAYKKEWKSFGDWLGTGRVSQQNLIFGYKTWKEAKPIYKELATKFNLKSRKEWTDFTNKNELPNGIPKYPWNTYSKENVLRRKKNE